MDIEHSPVRDSLRHCDLGTLVDTLASDAVVPGAGTASGVALALASACAAKAVAITLRHRDDATLRKSRQELREISERALVLARDDALWFERSTTGTDDGADVGLLRTDRDILEYCRTLEQVLAQHESRIAGNMAGDWLAARTLCHAARVIQEANVRELDAQTR